uniref:Replication protein A 70 kDa DNA-binding subunit B/D first OB fold domain-containing protein n=1 Tax=Lactuca sativa TaxID=4236 RepID=A0A9R1W8Z7_LACSA|nr:hypothetical protein LSAT_V11C200053830 [Lactuca sativa]
MAHPNVTFIVDLDVLKDSTIKVRVINLWNLFSFYNNVELFSIELILIYEQGTKIQANVLKKYIYRFKSILKDGLAFYIKCLSFASQKMGAFSFLHDTWFLSLLITNLLSHWPILKTLLSVNVIGLIVAFGEMVRDNADIKKHRLNL